MNALISKRFYRNIDTDNMEHIVSIHQDDNLPFSTIQGKATQIISSNSFHLNSEFEELLEKYNIEPETVRDALEDGSSYVEVTVIDTPITRSLILIDTLTPILTNALNLDIVKVEENDEGKYIVGKNYDANSLLFSTRLEVLSKNAGLSEEYALLKKHLLA